MATKQKLNPLSGWFDMVNSTGTNPGDTVQLDSNGKIPIVTMPATVVTERFVAASEADMLALPAQVGDICSRTDLGGKIFQLMAADPTNIDNWLIFNAVSSVNGEIGDVIVNDVKKSETAPENPVAGTVWYDAVNNVLKVYNGEYWIVTATTNGVYPQMHVGLADNLYTSENIIDIDSWNFRTTAGSESVPSSGTASLNYIQGNMTKSGAANAVFTTTTSAGISATIDRQAFIEATDNTTGTYTFTLTSGVWDTDPSTYGITTIVQQAVFTIADGTFSDGTGDIFKAYVNNYRGMFVMYYDGTDWRLECAGEAIGTDEDTEVFGITKPSDFDTTVRISYIDAVEDGTVTIDFVGEVRGTFAIANPAQLVATGVNQYDGTTYIDNVTIDPATGEIIAGNNKIVYVYAYGGVNNGYMGYSADGYIVNCGWSATLPTTGTTLTQTGTTVSSTSCSMPFANNGYFIVEVTDDTGLSIHPRRSGQQNTNTDAYVSYVVAIPTEDDDNNALPTASYGMPKIGNVYDEIDAQVKKYIQRIGYYSFSYANLNTVKALGVPYDYDTNSIFYVLAEPIEYEISSFDSSYTANDYGTERLLDSNSNIIPVTMKASVSYGTNLVDKLRTGVVELSSQAGNELKYLWGGSQANFNNLGTQIAGTGYLIF